MEIVQQALQTRFTEYLKSIEDECAGIRKLTEVIIAGNGRTAHFNQISEHVTKLKHLLGSIKRLRVKEELTQKEVNKRVVALLSKAQELGEQHGSTSA